MSASLAPELQHVQLGVGVHMGCEAAVHAVYKYIEAGTWSLDHTVSKLDLTIAFSTVLRPSVIREVICHFPAVAPMVPQAYFSPTVYGPAAVFSRATYWGRSFSP